MGDPLPENVGTNNSSVPVNEYLVFSSRGRVYFPHTKYSLTLWFVFTSTRIVFKYLRIIQVEGNDYISQIINIWVMTLNFI